VSRGDLDELPAQLAQLRELIREAHGATKDLRAAIREARSFADGLVALVDTAAESARRAAHEAGEQQMAAFQAHLQGELNRSAAKLNQAVIDARGHISRALTPKLASIDLTDSGEPGVLLVKFAGNLFDPDPDGTT
jgi:F0F1-type ATP synthase membrane subunit b/b'